MDRIEGAMSIPSGPKLRSKQQIEAIDALIREGGLSRSPRRHKSGTAYTWRSERATPEELTTAAPAPRISENGVEWLPVPQWETMRWLWHGFSTRRGGTTRCYGSSEGQGELNLGFTAEDSMEAVVRNRGLFAEAITGNSGTPVVTVGQFHSNLVVRVGRADAERKQVRKADGLMTDETGVLLAILTADCIPVLVADRKRRVVAAFHAGWRGTVKRIVESGVGRMRMEFGSRPEDLVAAIGPGVGACCYAVGEEVLSHFESQFTYAGELFREVYDPDSVRMKYPLLFLTQRAPGHSSAGFGIHLDLIEANRRQLLSAGVKPKAIRLIGGCTSCQRTLFFSHRASHGRAGRMMAAIGIGEAKA